MVSSTVYCSAVPTFVAAAEAGQNFVRDRTGGFGDILKRLMGAENLDKTAEGKRALGQGGDVHRNAVHRDTADDRQANAVEENGAAIAETAGKTVGIASGDRRVPAGTVLVWMTATSSRTTGSMGLGLPAMGAPP
jgi:hypothetical protein